MSRLDRVIGAPAGRRLKWIYLLAWFVVAGTLGSLAGQLESVQQNDAESWLPSSAESTQALLLSQELFGTGDDLGLVVVYVREDGLTAQDMAAVEADAATVTERLSGPPQVVSSGDGAAVLLTGRLPFSPDENWTELREPVEDIRDTVHGDLPDGLVAKVTGDAGASADFADAFAGLDAMLFLAALGIVTVLLIVTYRSPSLWLIPLLTVGLATGAAMGVVYLLAKYDVLVVNAQTASILPILAVGVGTDYALLITSRYREELHEFADRHDAMRVAVRRTAPAVLASAGTVILAMLVLVAAELNSTRSLGPVLAIGVGCVFLAMMTLLPALLVIVGRWIFWPFVPRHDEVVETEARHPFWSRVGTLVTRRARPVWLLTAAALFAVSFGTTTLNVGTQANGFTTETESQQGFDLLAAHFAGGQTAPLDIITDAGSAGEVAAAVQGVDGVAQVLPPQEAQGRVNVQVVLTDLPTSRAAEQTVDRIRDALAGVEGETLVGGQTAIGLDIQRASDRDNNVVIPLTLIVVVLVLAALLRAIVAPAVLLASVVLSFFAATGLSALIFHGLGYPDVDTGFFLSAFIFLVALGVDYTIFLMTRAREEVVTLHDHRAGVRKAVAVTGGVITSAGLVLAGTFSVLAVLPLVFLLQIGIVVALGVLLDTFVVRSLLVPAAAADIGQRFWWPSRLGRSVDVPVPRSEPGATTQPAVPL